MITQTAEYLPFIIQRHSRPECPVDDVAVARIPDEGEVTDSALLAPEAGAAVVDSSSGRGVDPSAGVEEREILRCASVVSRSVPVYGRRPASNIHSASGQPSGQLPLMGSCLLHFRSPSGRRASKYAMASWPTSWQRTAELNRRVSPLLSVLPCLYQTASNVIKTFIINTRGSD